MRCGNIKTDKKGVLELPIQYTVAAVVAAVAIAGMVVTIHSLWQEYEEKKAIEETKKIVDEAERIYGIGEEETIVTLKVNIPNSVKKIVFGSRDKALQNHYYILMKWGKNISSFSDAKFDYSVVYGGRKSIKVELVGEGEKLVKIE